MPWPLMWRSTHDKIVNALQKERRRLGEMYEREREVVEMNERRIANLRGEITHLNRIIDEQNKRAVDIAQLSIPQPKFVNVEELRRKPDTTTPKVMKPPQPKLAGGEDPEVEAYLKREKEIHGERDAKMRQRAEEAKARIREEGARQRREREEADERARRRRQIDDDGMAPGPIINLNFPTISTNRADPAPEPEKRAEKTSGSFGGSDGFETKGRIEPDGHETGGGFGGRYDSSPSSSSSDSSSSSSSSDSSSSSSSDGGGGGGSD